MYQWKLSVLQQGFIVRVWSIFKWNKRLTQILNHPCLSSEGGDKIIVSCPAQGYKALDLSGIKQWKSLAVTKLSSFGTLHPASQIKHLRNTREMWGPITSAWLMSQNKKQLQASFINTSLCHCFDLIQLWKNTLLEGRHNVSVWTWGRPHRTGLCVLCSVFGILCSY